MTLLFQSKTDDPEIWRRHLRAALPEETIRVYPDELDDPAEIDVALVWHPPSGLLASLPNLKAVFSLGAGVDHLASDPELPSDVPVVRMVDPGLTEGMTEYVVLSVLRHHRRFREYAELQAEHRWEELPVPLARGRRVGVMGLGELGTDAARALAALRFDVAGWARSRKDIAGVACFAGAEELGKFLTGSEILVCLLPLTEETRGILNRSTLGELPKGACVVNAARGAHLVDEDLLALLETGQIAEATLDVFHAEPLPPDHPFWDHPRVLVTPHAASVTPPETAAQVIAENVRRLRRGETPGPIVDFTKGY